MKSKPPKQAGNGASNTTGSSSIPQSTTSRLWELEDDEDNFDMFQENDTVDTDAPDHFTSFSKIPDGSSTSTGNNLPHDRNHDGLEKSSSAFPRPYLSLQDQLIMWQKRHDELQTVHYPNLLELIFRPHR